MKGEPSEMKSQYAGHDETLEVVEKFLRKTCIKMFCTEVCVGACCAGCYISNPEACHRKEGIRLACSCFLCPEIKRYLKEMSITTCSLTAYNKVSEALHRIINDIHVSGSIYFSAPSKEEMEGFRTSRTNLLMLNKYVNDIAASMMLLFNDKTFCVKFVDDQVNYLTPKRIEQTKEMKMKERRRQNDLS